MAETKQDLNESGVEAGARALFENDSAKMGPFVEAMLGSNDFDQIPATIREEYQRQATLVVEAYNEASA